MANNLAGQFDLASAFENASLTTITATNTVIANFSDGFTSDTAADFTAMIDWGDGQTTTGTVVGSNGSFTVESDHIYADEGDPTGIVTITRTTDGAQLVLQGEVTVDDNDNLGGHPVPTIVTNANQALSNVKVATFTDTNITNGQPSPNVPSDFTVNIDWGDGTTTAGTLSGGSGTFTVTGSHTYTTAGQFTITSFIADDGADNATGIATSTADVGFGGVLTPPSATEFVAIPAGTPVATFADNAGDPATDYVATIDWGDGTSTTGASVSGSGGSFTVTSTVAHTYADEGIYTEVVTVTNTADNTILTISGSATVAENDNLSAAGVGTISGSPGISTGNVTVATFSDTEISNTAVSAPNVAGDFIATIQWGDGTSSTGTVSGSTGGPFTVTGAHTYTQNGQDTISVDISDDAANGQNFANTTAQSTALIGLAPLSASNLNATEGTAIAVGTQVATFTDSNVSDQATDFSATVNWGDGTSSIGSVSGSNGSFTVSGGPHTYADEGQDVVTTTLTQTVGGNASATATGQANIADADVLSLTGDNISGDAGQALTNEQVATFTDTYTGNVASDFAATINWGDGSTTPGTVSGSGGSFTVDGSHTYTAGGQHTFTVKVADDDFGTAAASGTATASINFAGQMSLTAATEGTALPNNTPIVTFSDGNGGDTASDFTALINWGDGTSSTGTVVGSSGAFTIEGGHTYTDEGTEGVSVTFTQTAEQATATVSGNVAVADADHFTGQTLTVSATAQNNFSGPVATFTDTYTGQVANDLDATINWGDGFTTTGTVSGSNGSFTVSGAHSYESGGQYDVTVKGADDAPGTASFSVTSTADVSYAGQVVLTSATEGTALPNNTSVATFSDFNGGDTAGQFAATINWGDGTSSTGTVVGSPGTFTVEGGHTYSDEANESVSVTVTHSPDQVQGTFGGSVTVGEGDAFTPQGTSFTADVQQAFTGTVATFTDTYAGQVASDLAATIDWGDGTSSTGTVSGGSGSFTVGGTHTYSTVGQDTVKVTLADDAPGTATATATTTATVQGVTGQMVLASVSEGFALSNNTTIATFSDPNNSDAASDFTATINWGDGATTPGTVVGSNGSFTVEGGHTYADEGNEAASVTLTHTADHVQTTASGNIAVVEADVLTPQGTTFTVNAQQPFSGTVATFTDGFTGQVASDLGATIDWGDGHTTTGTVSGGSGSFTVGGSHTYAAGGQDNVKVTLADDAPGTATATATTAATVRSISGQMALTSATEGSALPNNTLATFSDTDTGDAASDFTATINWGDGATTAGTVVGSNGSFTVEGGHTYADEGSDAASVTLTHTADGLQATASGNVAVAEADVLTPQGTNFAVNAQQPFSGTVATFADSFTGNVAGDFSALINWGDGQTTTGTVSGGSGTFTVGGSHTYATGGQDSVKVTLADDAPGTATATATTTATVRSISGQMALSSATEGSALPNNTHVATFSDTDTADVASDFTATITWGDGTTASGTVVGSGGSFAVEGGQTYADEGNDAASVTLTHTADGLQAIASGTVSVADADVFTGQGTSITARASQAFSGTVATFTDAFTGQVASDLSATIDWGDGQTTTGSVSGGNGSFTVGGSHTYSTRGQDSVKVTLADDAPGTATGTATSTVNVQPAEGIPFDFNADTISDLVFQNEGFNGGAAAGTPQIWLWNGTAVTSQVTFPNPGASWHIITSRDLNGDGKADLIWQNSDGTPGVWLMNGTTPIAEAGLTNPGPSWQVVASGDTNGDGNSDLIWRNSDGTLGVWLMNGTTVTAEAGLTNPGSNWKVVGAADYNGDGKDDILLQDANTGNLMVDLMNGTTIASTVSITVGDPSWHAVSTGEFNGQAEIAWQNNNGSVGIWLMNGTTPVAEAGLGSPGAGWQLISVDHFTPNGQADLLFQNTNGSMMLWEMNGTSVAATLNLPNPGAGWQSQNGHPFAAAGT